MAVSASQRVSRGRRLAADDRREEILARASSLFAERPYAQVSTTVIAFEAGVARGLLNHYFGTKRDLYVEVVRRMVELPELEAKTDASGSLRVRVDRGVNWFLDAADVHGHAFLCATGTEGLGADPEIEKILARADDLVARRVLEVLGMDPESDRLRGAIRAYSGLATSAVKEWRRAGSLTREDIHLLLSCSLLAIARDVLPTFEK